MNLNSASVQHKKYGQGVIQEVGGDYVFIEFGGGIKKLRDDEVTFYKTSATSYPDSVKYNLCNNKQGLFDDEKK